MNTNIMKERIKVKTTLVNNFSQELNLYDVVITHQYGSMRPAIITKINDSDKSIRLDICQRKFYSRELLLAKGILSQEEIKKYVDKFMSNKAAKQAAIDNKISYKFIFGYWQNLKTKKFGILITKIPSCPGKQVSKKNIQSSLEKLQEFFNQNKQYRIQYFIDENFNISSDILKANTFTSSGLSRYISFELDSIKYQKNFCENPITGQEEFSDFLNKDYIFLIIEKKSEILKKFNGQMFLNFSTSNMDENVIFYRIDNSSKSYGFVQHLYCHKEAIKDFVNKKTTKSKNKGVKQC